MSLEKTNGSLLNHGPPDGKIPFPLMTARGSVNDQPIPGKLTAGNSSGSRRRLCKEEKYAAMMHSCGWLGRYLAAGTSWLFVYAGLFNNCW